MSMSRTEEREEVGVSSKRSHKKKASVSDGSSNSAGLAFHVSAPCLIYNSPGFHV